MSNSVKDKDEKHLGPEYLSPYPVSRQAPAFELIDLAREIAEVDDMLAVQATGKLKVLAEQMEALRLSAHKILTEARFNQKLHHAHCSFKKIAGKTYHLYQKPDKTLLFSLIGPHEWGTGRKPPYDHVGDYRLEPDYSWKKVD